MIFNGSSNVLNVRENEKQSLPWNKFEENRREEKELLIDTHDSLGFDPLTILQFLCYDFALLSTGKETFIFNSRLYFNKFYSLFSCILDGKIQLCEKCVSKEHNGINR